jgi:hypothetical protein
VDCMAVVQMYAKGLKKATSASSLFADTWSLIQAAWDGSDAVNLAWMPSHTASADIGVATLSNGEALTELDRDANAIADDLAKTAASLHRVHEATRAAIDEEAERVHNYARFIGAITFAANHTETSHGIMRESAPATR